MGTKSKLLIVDDDIDICALLQRFFERNGFDIEVLYSSADLIKTMRETDFDLILCDYRLRNQEGDKTLATIKNEDPSMPVIFMTAYGDIKCAVSVIKAGAFDYITKPLLPDELLRIVKSAIGASSSSQIQETQAPAKRPVKKDKQEQDTPYFVGTCPSMKALYRQIDLVAPTNFSVIISGESGSGKEVVAKTIHERSRRKDGPFIAVDCGTLTRELANSELFGHKKGAFTGAIQDKKGCFELANHGTLFLDEITNLSYDIQGALLRVIQERKVKRTGDPKKEIELDIRIIVASHENLQKKCEEGVFRHDLFHRLNEFNVKVPSLRERKEDIPSMATFILQKVNKELHKEITGIDEEVIRLFKKYPWPGNIREFWNAIRRAALMEETDQLRLESFDQGFIETTFADNHQVNVSEESLSPSLPKDLKTIRSRAEYKAILKVLKAVNFNKSKAADLLNIDRKTLYNKIKEFEEMMMPEKEGAL